MRVLLYHCLPFCLAHGGLQAQISRTHEALLETGIEAEYLDWHRPDQSGDILHFFGRIPRVLVEHARQKGIKIVVADLLGAQGARSRGRLRLETWLRRGAEKFFPSGLKRQLSWTTYRDADACIALTSWEGHLLNTVFGVPSARIHVIPNGVDAAFLNSRPAKRKEWLLCVGTITPIKRVLELAKAACYARTPIRFVGQPYSESDPYAREFRNFAEAHPEFIQYHGPVHDRRELAQAYREARGFVLLSAWESLSLAALEAAATECPMLLSDLPWAKAVFQDAVSVCPPKAGTTTIASHLRAFYDHAPELPVPPKPPGWLEVARQLGNVYRGLFT